MTTTLAAVQPDARSYADHARPAWQRVLFNREMAVIALLVVVVGVASAVVRCSWSTSPRTW